MKPDHEQLEEYRSSGVIVRCRSRFDYSFDGFIEDWSDRWILIRTVSGGMLADGYTTLRLKCVKKIHPHRFGQFYGEALQIRKQTWQSLVEPHRIDMRKAATIIISAFETFPLVTIYQEYLDPDSCSIGCEGVIRKKRICWAPIKPDAELEEERLCYELKDITRIQFGGLYEDALWSVYTNRQKKQ